jgi:molecular chaperone HscB
MILQTIILTWLCNIRSCEVNSTNNLFIYRTTLYIMQNKNYFELFGLIIEFDIDLANLKKIYLFMQAQFHPDKSKEHKVLAHNASAFISNAYETLHNDSSRALYWCELHNMQISQDLLIQQIEWHEALEQETDIDKIKKIKSEAKNMKQQFVAEFAQSSNDILNNSLSLGVLAQQILMLDNFIRSIST